jgi:flagellar hook-length control protein FliK
MNAPIASANSDHVKNTPAESSDADAAVSSVALITSKNSSSQGVDSAPASRHKHQENAGEGENSSLAAVMLSFAAGGGAPTQTPKTAGHAGNGKVSATTSSSSEDHVEKGDRTSASHPAAKEAKSETNLGGDLDSDLTAAPQASGSAGGTAEARGKVPKATSDKVASSSASKSTVTPSLPSLVTLSSGSLASGSTATGPSSTPAITKGQSVHTGEPDGTKGASSQAQGSESQAGNVLAAIGNGEISSAAEQGVPTGSGLAATSPVLPTSTDHGTVLSPNKSDTVSAVSAATTEQASSLAPLALAATVTAMQQGGQNTAILRLDPPDLGSLSIHVTLGQAGAVNVAFVPTTPQAAQILHVGLDSFRQSMAASGLTLGQAEVSSGGGQGAGPGHQGHQNNLTGDSQNSSVASTGSSEVVTNNGVRAYA